MTMGRSRTHLTIDNALASVRYSVIRGGGGASLFPVRKLKSGRGRTTSVQLPGGPWLSNHTLCDSQRSMRPTFDPWGRSQCKLKATSDLDRIGPEVP